MNKQEQIEEMTKERNEIKDIMKLLDKCVSLNPMCKSEVASVLYGNKYRKIPENAVVLTKEEYIDLSRNYVREQIEKARKETAKVILYMLYDMGIDKETLECCIIYDVNGVSLAKQICEKYGVEIEK